MYVCLCVFCLVLSSSKACLRVQVRAACLENLRQDESGEDLNGEVSVSSVSFML